MVRAGGHDFVYQGTASTTQQAGDDKRPVFFLRPRQGFGKPAEPGPGFIGLRGAPTKPGDPLSNCNLETKVP